MSFINYNGRLYPDAEVLFGTDNRAFRFGEGLIETMLWRKGQIRFFNDHMERLNSSLEILRWPAFPLSAHQLGKEIEQIVKSNLSEENLMVRLQVFRLNKEASLHFLLESIPLDSRIFIWQENGLSLGLSQNIIKSADSIANLKTTSRLGYAIAAQEAEQQGWDDILLCNASGNIVESSISNIFWITEEAVWTPPLSEGCIAGVMRKKLLQANTLAALPVYERELDIPSLNQATEIFLSNAIRGIQLVTSFNGNNYPSLITRNIFNQFEII